MFVWLFVFLELEVLDNNVGGDEGEDGSEVRRVKRELWRSNE